MKNRITIKDIAEALGITPATVSRALSDHPEISLQTKQRVKEVSEQMGYKINRIAASLQSGKTKVIGVLIPTAEHPFFGAVIHGISNLASAGGYDILIYQSNELYQYEVKGINAFISAGVDGIMVSVAKDTVDYSHFSDAQLKGIPVVFFDRSIESFPAPSITINDFKGAFLATEHLIKQGYRHIAHICGPRHIKAFNDRVLGYQSALENHQLIFNPDFLITGSISMESGSDGIKHLLSLKQPPDAVFAVEDFTALGVIKELKNQKISVPEQIGVFGFCNDIFSEHVTPSISTVDQQNIKMGEQSFKLLIGIINGNKDILDDQTKIVLEPVLILRESSQKKFVEV